MESFNSSKDCDLPERIWITKPIGALFHENGTPLELICYCAAQLSTTSCNSTFELQSVVASWDRVSNACQAQLVHLLEVDNQANPLGMMPTAGIAHDNADVRRRGLSRRCVRRLAELSSYPLAVQKGSGISDSCGISGA